MATRTDDTPQTHHHDDDDDDDDDDGWIDECEGMTEEELKELAESVRPLRLLLVKVR